MLVSLTVQYTDSLTDIFCAEGPSVTWEKIEKLPGGAVIDYNSLPTPTTENIHHFLDKLVVVKLNGGLGTSMGCKGPKSVIQVRNDLTFLDLTVQQIEVGPIYIWIYLFCMVNQTRHLMVVMCIIR